MSKNKTLPKDKKAPKENAQVVALQKTLDEVRAENRKLRDQVWNLRSALDADSFTKGQVTERDLKTAMEALFRDALEVKIPDSNPDEAGTIFARPIDFEVN